jgi:hypothetical protein
MTEELQQIAKEEIEKLPKESRDAIASVDWGGISEDITKKYFWQEETINDLQAEILVVLIGLENPALFRIHLENNIGATSEEAEGISREVTQRIFVPVSQKLQDNIRKSGKVESAGWQKTLGFILSGGNFLVYLETPGGENKL